VVRLLEAAQRSIEQNGRVISLRDEHFPASNAILNTSNVAAAD
jgi:hypothetical protein